MMAGWVFSVVGGSVKENSKNSFDSEKQNA